jgi:tRNA-specific 2-thiouridylase
VGGLREPRPILARMDGTSFERHLRDPRGRGPVPADAVVGSAGGAACNDLVRLALVVRGGRINDATFDAEGCGAVIAAGSACVELVRGRPLLDAARVSSPVIARRLGGLSGGKLHAADLAADALHRALTNLWATDIDRLMEPVAGRVLVGLSGGVDSAVAALLAREAGNEVVAVTLKLWADPATDGTRSCCSPQAVVSARALAHSMGFPHLTLDLEERFRSSVVQDFLQEHDRGRTPNPCVRCNGMVRFDAMLRLADCIGAEALLTGHYARVERDESGPLLARAVDDGKDQTYMLAALPPALLERVRFPLGELRKAETRELARSHGLAVADKKESQDLCFMAGTTRERFLVRHTSDPDRTGAVVDPRGRVLGRHRGHRHYTVGQRRGLGVASREPLYVLEKDGPANRIVVGCHEQLATRRVTVAPATLYRDGRRVDRVRLRYRSEPVGCELADSPAAGVHDQLNVLLDEPVYGVAPGQTACLLEGSRIVGHGTIS